MTRKSLVMFGVLAVLMVAVTLPAEAAKRKRHPVYYDAGGRQITISRRAPTRLTVRARSYLDPGTETKQHAEHYGDYAFPPGYSVYYDRNDWRGSFVRMPLADPWDLPGYPKF